MKYNLKAVRAISRYQDIPYLGSFESDNPRLNDIWRTGAYTVHLCMENDVLLSLVSLMLPENILSRFSIVNVEKSSDGILIYLDEKIDAKYASNNISESKGF